MMKYKEDKNGTMQNQAVEYPQTALCNRSAAGCGETQGPEGNAP